MTTPRFRECTVDHVGLGGVGWGGGTRRGSPCRRATSGNAGERAGPDSPNSPVFASRRLATVHGALRVASAGRGGGERGSAGWPGLQGAGPKRAGSPVPGQFAVWASGIRANTRVPGERARPPLGPRASSLEMSPRAGPVSAFGHVGSVRGSERGFGSTAGRSGRRTGESGRRTGESRQRNGRVRRSGAVGMARLRRTRPWLPDSPVLRCRAKVRTRARSSRAAPGGARRG